MKAVIYTTEAAAQTALEQCSTLASSSVELVGEGPHTEPEQVPYSNILKHPTEDKWALIADEKVETKLKKTAEELSADWFPQIPQPENITENGTQIIA